MNIRDRRAPVKESEFTAIRTALLQGGYRPVPAAGKRVLLQKWTECVADAAAIAQWAREPSWTNTSIQTATTPALDIDITDSHMVAAAMDVVRQYLNGGLCLIRTGRAPKCAVLFRTETPFRKLRLEFPAAPRVDGKPQAIEWLGTGQQIVVHGIHPDTNKPYTWADDATPWTHPRAALPAITAAEALDLLQSIADAIEAAGGPAWRTTALIQTAPPPAVHTDDPKLQALFTVTQPPDMEPGHWRGISNRPEDNLNIFAGLAAIDPDLNQNEWIGIGGALYSVLGDEEGFRVWDAWSAKGSKYAQETPRSMRGRWRCIVGADGYNYSIGTLIHFANQARPDAAPFWWDKPDAAPEWWGKLKPEPEVGTPEAETAPLNEPREPVDTSAPEPERRSDARDPEATGESAKQAPPPTNQSALHWHGDRPAELQWCVKHLLKECDVALLSGQWGTLKTFIALHLAVCVMTQRPFIDYRVKRPGGVLYFAAEGAGSIPLRLNAAIAQQLGQQMHLEDLPQLPFVWSDIQVNILKGEGTALVRIAREAAQQLRERFHVDLVLIIVDTVGASAGYKDEDSSAQAQYVMDALKRLSRAVNACVLGIDHLGKDETRGTRGSSAKETNAETVLLSLGDRELTGRITNHRLTVRKVRDGESGRVIPFRREVINCGVDADGDAVTTCVVHWEPDRKPAERAKGGRPKRAADVFSAALNAALEQHGESISPGVRAVKRDSVRDVFKGLNPSGDTAAAIKKRWQRDLKANIELKVVITDNVGGVDYLRWAPETTPF